MTQTILLIHGAWLTPASFWRDGGMAGTAVRRVRRDS
jgi:hypothetical protein